jgi:D-amino-acid oxidase
MPPRVTVVGAGVIGLTCGVRLAEAGVAVDVLARDLPLETASATAPGLWLPAGPGWGGEREAAWARATLAELRAADGDVSGVRCVPGHLLDRQPGAAAPRWPESYDGLRPEAETAPAAGYPTGWRLRLPLADPRRYLPWLRERLVAAGGTLTRLALPALPARGVVVDAAGVAARALASDPRVEAVRTQVVLAANPGVDAWWWDPAGSFGVLPLGDVVAVEGPGERGEWNTAPDEAAGRALLERAAQLAPRLAGAQVAGLRVGLRPARPSVRLEAEHRASDEDADRMVIHCYGHGSHGFTLSWGCADDVLRIVSSLP